MLITLVCLFPFLSQPLSMGITLLLTTLMLSMILGPLFTHFWISYTLILVLLGALLVIFIYVSLIASNEQFILLNPMVLASLMFFSFFTSLWFFNQNEPLNLSENQNYFSEMNNEGTLWLKMFYSEQLNILILFLVCYLFLTLVIIVKNTNSHNLSLRSQF
nr:NADH dehydrogenase subunit 6 [Eurycercus lamellatus]